MAEAEPLTAEQAAEDVQSWQTAEKILEGLEDFETFHLNAEIDKGAMKLELDDSTMKDAFGPDWLDTLVASIRKTETRNINNVKKRLVGMGDD